MVVATAQDCTPSGFSPPVAVPRLVGSQATSTVKFEWDPVKARVNLTKHGVSFEEASTAFGDPLSLSIRDPDTPQNEPRHVLIGVSWFDRTLVVVHGELGDTIRIISARKATRRERRE